MLPRIAVDYGSDPDAMQMIEAAHNTLTSGSYQPSRVPPGFPIYDALHLALHRWRSPILFNLISLIFFVACIPAFARLWGRSENRFVATALFALTPILLKNAAVSLDYIPGLAFVLWSCERIKKKKTLTASVLLALAVGLRLTNILFLATFSLYLIAKKEPRRDILLFVTTCVALSGLFYFPVYRAVGAAMFVFPAKPTSLSWYTMATGYRSLMLFGPPATIVLLGVLLFNSKAIYRSGRHSFGAFDYLCVSSVVLFLLLFIRHSNEVEYLIPAVPFIYLFILQRIPRAQLLLVVVFLVAESFVTIDILGGESGRERPGLRPSWGRIVQDYRDRQEMEALRNGLDEFPGPDRSFVITGLGSILTFDNPQLQKVDLNDLPDDLRGVFERHPQRIYHIHKIKNRDVYLIYRTTKEALFEIRDLNYRLYMFSEFAPDYMYKVQKLDPEEATVERLAVITDDAFYKQK